MRNKEVEFVTKTPLHPRDRLKRNSKNKLSNKKSKESEIKFVKQTPVNPQERFRRNTRNRLKRKLAKKPATHPRERGKRIKETEIAKKNHELENLDIETLKSQKFFDVNVSLEKEKKQESQNLIINKIREKLPPDNDDIYTIYNHEDNSYELKTDNKKNEKEYIINGLHALNKKIELKK